MGSDQLMEELVGEVRDDAKAAWRRHFDPLKDEIRPCRGPATSSWPVADAGGLVVLASSAEPEDVDALVAALDVGDVVHAVTSSGDVEQAKPAPDASRPPVDAAGVPPERAVVVVGGRQPGIGQGVDLQPSAACRAAAPCGVGAGDQLHASGVEPADGIQLVVV